MLLNLIIYELLSLGFECVVPSAVSVFVKNEIVK